MSLKSHHASVRSKEAVLAAPYGPGDRDSIVQSEPEFVIPTSRVLRENRKGTSFKEASHGDVESDPAPDNSQVLAALERICSSAAFHGSRRCQEFLRFIVQETLQGHADALKERAIATEVFGRGTDFEPGETSLVRVKARELRKRLESFYETDSELTCRIEIPLGGYTPRFISISRATSSAADDPTEASVEPAAIQLTDHPPAAVPWSRRKLLWASASILGGAAVGAGFVLNKAHAPTNSLEQLWDPVFHSAAPLVIFVPVLKDRSTQELTDRVGIGPAQALSKVITFMDAHHCPYQVRFGSEMNFALLKEQPSLLLGGFSSTWTAFMTRGLRFTLQWNPEKLDRAILDTVTKKTWFSVNPTSQGYADADYGLLTRLFDQETGQISMIAGGLTTFGTQAAAEILYNANDLKLVLNSAPAGWQKKNFQVVVNTVIVGATPSRPRIVDVHFW